MSARVEQRFVDCCNRYISSKLILSTQPLQDLLKLLASEKELFAIIENAAKDFDFKEEYENAKIETSTGSVLRLPRSGKALIAFVTTLLYSFDSGSISVLDFLEKFYPSEEGVKGSFPIMCQAVIVPYRDIMVSALHGEQEEEEVLEAEEIVEKEPSIPDGAVAQGGRALRALAKSILEDGSLTSQEKNDLLTVTDSALYALEIRDRKMVKAFNVALKHLLADVKGAPARLKDFESALKLYLII